MEWGYWKLNCDNESDKRTLECTKPEFFYCIDLGRIRNSAGMLDWIYQIYHKGDVIGPQEMYDLLAAFDHIFKPQQTLCSGGNDKVIEPMGT
jgi:hypothetical protein